MNEVQITRTMAVEDWLLSFWSGDEEPRLRDVELGERLGYDRPRDIRQLIERRKDDPGFGEVCGTVTQTLPQGGRPSTEYHLTEAQALEISAISETPNGKTILRALIRVFILARRGMLPGQGKPRSTKEIFEEYKPAVLAAMGKKASLGDVEAAQLYLKLGRPSHHKKPTSEPEVPTPPRAAPKTEQIQALLLSGLSPKEVAKQGFTKAHVYLIAARLRAKNPATN